jgi:hypothetical protein
MTIYYVYVLFDLGIIYLEPISEREKKKIIIIKKQGNIRSIASISFAEIDMYLF